MPTPSEIIAAHARMCEYLMSLDKACYERMLLENSIAKPNVGSTKSDIVNAVYKKMQAIRIDIDYDFVKEIVVKFLDNVGFKENVTNSVNPYYKQLSDRGMLYTSAALNIL